MALVLLLSSLFCILSNSWLAVWTSLEINTLSFCTLLNASSKGEAQNSNESAMNYLLIQIIASGILLVATSWGALTNQSAFMIYLLITMSILINAASAPFHQWFVNVSNNINWSINSVLFTWQNIAPLYLILFQINNLIAGFILVTALTGALSLMNNSNFNEVLAYSSVFNLSWMLMAVIISSKLFFLFSSIYWISVWVILWPIANTKVEILSDISNKMNNPVTLMLMANLAGIPPFMGFLANWIVFSHSLYNFTTVLVTILLVTSTINFYVYLRAMGSNLINSSPSSQKANNILSGAFFVIFLTLNLSAVLSVSL